MIDLILSNPWLVAIFLVGCIALGLLAYAVAEPLWMIFGRYIKVLPVSVWEVVRDWVRSQITRWLFWRK